VSDPGTGLEVSEQGAAEEVREVWQKVALLVWKVHGMMSQTMWPNP